MQRAGRVGFGVVCALAGWVFADLYLRVDLPLAADLLHLAFRAAAACAGWLQEGDGHRPRDVVVGAAVVLAGGLAITAAGRGLWFWRVVAIPAVALQVAFIVIACLMERGLAAALVAVGVALALKVRGRDGGRPAMLARAALAGATTALAALYLGELLAARSEGYGLLTWAASRADALPGRALLLPAAALLAAGILAAAWPLFVAGLPDRRWEPATWPTRLGPLVVVALVLVGHAYAARVLVCPDVVDGVLAGGGDVVRLAPAGAEPAFRIALRGDGGLAAVAERGRRRIGFVRLDADGAPTEIGSAAPGALPAYEADRRDHDNQSLASIEELLWAPGAERFFGTALGGHPDFYSMPNSPSNVVNNVVIELGPDAAEVTRSVGLEHLCWLGAMAWREADARLYLGCEYEPSLHRYDPETGRVEASLTDEAIGDVAALVLDPDGTSLYTVSFWSSQAVAEVDPETMTVRQRRDVGGAHYDLALDAAADRLFLSSYYGSRVRILRASDLAPVGRIPTGLGTRALATDPSRDLVLASSAYDGMLTIARSSTGEVLERHRVGGHVKDIAIDAARGRALVSSQCGLISVVLPGR